MKEEPQLYIAKIISPNLWGSVWAYPDEVECDQDLEYLRKQAMQKALRILQFLELK